MAESSAATPGGAALPGQASASSRRGRAGLRQLAALLPAAGCGRTGRPAEPRARSPAARRPLAAGAPARSYLRAPRALPLGPAGKATVCPRPLPGKAAVLLVEGSLHPAARLRSSAVCPGERHRTAAPPQRAQRIGAAPRTCAPPTVLTTAQRVAVPGGCGGIKTEMLETEENSTFLRRVQLQQKRSEICLQSSKPAGNFITRPPPQKKKSGSNVAIKGHTQKRDLQISASLGARLVRIQKNNFRYHW